MRAAMAWVRAGWRRRAPALTALLVIAGLAGGAVLTVVAGARRTGSSIERFTTSVDAADVVLQVRDIEPAVLDRIEGLTGVEGTGVVTTLFAVSDRVDADMALFAPNDGRMGVDLERDRLLRGRRPALEDPNEVTVTEDTAAALGVDVGDRVAIQTLTPEQVDTERYFPPEGPTLDLDVVGITRSLNDLAGTGDLGLAASPALLPTVRGRVDEFARFVAIAVADDADPEAVEAAVASVMPAGEEFDTFSLAVRTKPADESAQASAGGLRVFALLAGMVGLVVIAQAVGRHLAGEDADQRTVAALGMTRAERVTALVGWIAPVAVAAAGLAMLVAVVASRSMPIGIARRAEPDPGQSLDWVVLAPGAAAVAVVVLGSALLAALLLTRPVAAPSPSTSSSVADAAARAGAGPAAVAGLRLALDRRSPSLPTFPAGAGLVVAILGVVAVVTFGASLGRLDRAPERWGSPWDLTLQFTASTVEEATAVAMEDRRLSAVARWNAGFTYVGGEGARAFGLAPLTGSIDFATTSGRSPSGPGEVVLGADTASRLGVAVGDTVEVAADPGAERRSLEVAGIGLFPQIDDGDFTDAIGLYGDAFTDLAQVPDLFEASQLVVRVADDADLAPVMASFNARFENSVSPESLPLQPRQVTNLSAVRPLLGWMGAFVAALGIASLLHLLRSTAARRRGVLATLRSLGMTRRQATACLVWQAITIAAAGVAIGVPAGLAVGGWTWRAVADSVAVANDAVRPTAPTAAVVVVVVVAAVLLAAAAGVPATRGRPAGAMRAE